MGDALYGVSPICVWFAGGSTILGEQTLRGRAGGRRSAEGRSAVVGQYNKKVSADRFLNSTTFTMRAVRL